jgi:hypothetical protein
MSNPTRTSPPAGVSGHGDSADAHVRKVGRQLIFTAYGALRAVKLYPVENAAVQKALADLATQSKELVGSEGELELRMSGEFIFVNQTRLRLDLDNFASFSHLLALFRACGIGFLDSILNGKGFLGRREDPEIRACAAMALGRVKTAKAIEALRKASDEKEIVVRNAVNKALRGPSAT